MGSSRTLGEQKFRFDFLNYECLQFLTENDNSNDLNEGFKLAIVLKNTEVMGKKKKYICSSSRTDR